MRALSSAAITPRGHGAPSPTAPVERHLSNPPSRVHDTRTFHLWSPDEVSGSTSTCTSHAGEALRGTCASDTMEARVALLSASTTNGSHLRQRTQGGGDTHTLAKDACARQKAEGKVAVFRRDALVRATSQRRARTPRLRCTSRRPEPNSSSAMARKRTAKDSFHAATARRACRP